MKRIILFIGLFVTLTASAWEREDLWPKGKIPDASDKQIAAMTDETSLDSFNPDKYRMPYLEWFEAPDENVRTGACMILISGGLKKNAQYGHTERTPYSGASRALLPTFRLTRDRFLHLA